MTCFSFFPFDYIQLQAAAINGMWSENKEYIINIDCVVISDTVHEGDCVVCDTVLEGDCVVCDTVLEGDCVVCDLSLIHI